MKKLMSARNAFVAPGKLETKGVPDTSTLVNVSDESDPSELKSHEVRACLPMFWVVVTLSILFARILPTASFALTSAEVMVICPRAVVPRSVSAHMNTNKVAIVFMHPPGVLLSDLVSDAYVFGNSATADPICRSRPAASSFPVQQVSSCALYNLLRSDRYVVSSRLLLMRAGDSPGRCSERATGITSPRGPRRFMWVEEMLQNAWP